MTTIETCECSDVRPAPQPAEPPMPTTREERDDIKATLIATEDEMVRLCDHIDRLEAECVAWMARLSDANLRIGKLEAYLKQQCERTYEAAHALAAAKVQARREERGRILSYLRQTGLPMTAGEIEAMPEVTP